MLLYRWQLLEKHLSPGPVVPWCHGGDLGSQALCPPLVLSQADMR